MVFWDLFLLNWIVYFAGLLDFNLLVLIILVLDDLCFFFFLHFDVLLVFLDHLWDLFVVFFDYHWSFNSLILHFWSFLNSFDGINNLSRSLLDWLLYLRLGKLSR